jgi:DNA-binding PadR family transcriptional regulator
MNRHRHHASECGHHWHLSAGGADHPRRGRGRGEAFGRHRGGPFSGRGPRMFDPGALRLVVLGLIAEEPRHGYDIIRALGEKFQGSYSPSPGAIYPMLQMLEEADLVVSEVNGNKRLFSITGEGRAYLADNAAELDRIGAQIAQVAGRMTGVAIGEELKALRWMIHAKMRAGGWSGEQVEKARTILERARQELEGL